MLLTSLMRLPPRLVLASVARSPKACRGPTRGLDHAVFRASTRGAVWAAKGTLSAESTPPRFDGVLLGAT